MSERYKIHIDPKLPSKKEIEQYKNFPGMVRDYEKLHRPGYIIRNLHKDRRLMRMIILIMIILLTIFLTHEATTEKQEKDAPKQEEPASEQVESVIMDNT